MHLAAAWKLPLIFFIENNQYAVASTVAESTAEPRLAARGLGFAIPAWRVDGMNPLAVMLAMEQALKIVRAGKGPAIIEADVYRYFHQNGPLPGSAFGYRSKQEEAEWRARDPLIQVGQEMTRRAPIDEADIDDLRLRAKKIMASIAGELTEPQGNRRIVNSALWPSPEFRDTGVRSDLSELCGMPSEEQESFRGDVENRKFVEVIADVLTRRMEQDPTMIVLGEDVHRLKGGTNGATRGLGARFADRVLGTPISENAFFGLASGMAMDGRFKPVVEFMYADFMWVAADQVFNQVGKATHIFGGDIDIPLVLRTKVPIGGGYGSQHSMDPAGVFATAPGWRVVAPSTAFDYVGLMNAALACKDPVLVIEHLDLYPMPMAAPVGNLDYIIPPGKAALRREQSVRKTNNVLIVEQGARGTSYGGWLADEIQRRLFDWLDQPVMRVTGGEASPSISKVLERSAYAGAEEVAAALNELLRCVA
jgi:2-oxoisovalerate dehydrogenase E1 component